MDEIAVRVKNLSKIYRIGKAADTPDTLVGRVSDFLRLPTRNLRRLRRLSRFTPDELAAAGDVIWALRDVSFEVRRGEVLGVIGRNGAGKSTLLKVLSRITHPTSGRVELLGRVSSLLEVGTGFHPELTGRDNVYLNGTILGMTRIEIDHKFDEIVAFSGVEKFIDTPVKYYSSGMRVRLAFSVAAHLEPEILIVDEVLAVGDIEFQNKCIGKMEEVAGQGRTVIFVSHNMPAVRALCSKGVVLELGKVEFVGDATGAVTHYLTTRSEELDRNDLTGLYFRDGSGNVRFTAWTLIDEEIGEGDKVVCGNRCTFMIDYSTEGSDGPVRNVAVSITIKDVVGQHVLTGATEYTNGDFSSLPMRGRMFCDFETMPLLPGRYDIHLWCAANDELADRIESAGSFHVLESDFYGTGKSQNRRKHGLFLVRHQWGLVPEERIAGKV